MPSDDRSIDNAITVDHLRGLVRGKSGMAYRIRWIALPNQFPRSPSPNCPLSAVCRAPRRAISPPGSLASHPFLLPGHVKPCHRKQPTTPSRWRPLASDDALVSRAMPVAYASPGMSWALHYPRRHSLCNPRADECLMCQMRRSATEVLVLSIASIGMPIRAQRSRHQHRCPQGICIRSRTARDDCRASTATPQ
jgi:hypothetical protein